MSLKKKIAAFGDWLNVERRQKIQAAVAAAAPLLLSFGLLTSSQFDQIAIILGALLALVAPLVSLANLSRTEFASWLVTSARGVLYGAAAVIVPALAMLGLFSDQTSTHVLGVISSSLTVLSSVVAIFTSGRQNTIERIADADATAVVSVLMKPVEEQREEFSRATERVSGVADGQIRRSSDVVTVDQSETLPPAARG